VTNTAFQAVSLALGAAYGALAIFIALARLPRADRVHFPRMSKTLWLRTRLPMMIAAGLTATSSASAAFLPANMPADTIVMSSAWMAALLAWTIAVISLEAVCRGRSISRLPSVQRNLLAALILVFAALLVMGVIDPAVAVALTVDGNLVFALIVLVLLENIMRNAEREILWHISLPAVATGGLALVSLLLYGSVVLRHHFAASLIDARLAFLLMVLPIFAVGAMRAIRWRPRRLQLSKDAAFYSASLILGGSFMVVLGVIGTLLHDYGAGMGAAVEWAVMFAGLLALGIVASSGSARSRLMLMLSRHFGAAPYDYRQEWLRCLATLSTDHEVSVAQRAIKTLADTADSPTGILLLHDREHACLRYAEGWNTALELPGLATDAPLFAEIVQNMVIELAPDGPLAPFWLAVALPDPFAAGPLGVVVLSRPRAAQKLHREMVALLSVVAGEISLVMAERRAAEALAVARKFEATGKRFAFVAHDIKNVANQLALLIDNAQRHMADPAFQADLIATVSDSVEKIRAMIRRLDQGGAESAARLDVGAQLRTLLARRDLVTLEETPGESMILIDPLVFDMMINHLLDNARDASAAGQVVTVALAHEAGWVTIRIIDRGCGMSAHFIREQLFKPFSSTKQAGFGLGAFQTRELVVQAGGSLDVVSDEAVGTTITIRLPTVAPAPMVAPGHHGEGRHD
jgi:putative PEP-CTERM system histidine kinase